MSLDVEQKRKLLFAQASMFVRDFVRLGTVVTVEMLQRNLGVDYADAQWLENELKMSDEGYFED